jgi:hypothetical protein
MAQVGPRSKAAVHRERGGSRIILMLRRSKETDIVTCIPQESTGLRVQSTPGDEFDASYEPVYNFPVGRSAALHVRYATQMGGTTEAMAELATLVDVPDDDIAKSTERLATNKSKPVKGSTRRHKTQKAAAEHAASEARKKRTRKSSDSPASMIDTLIMEGAYTDDEIAAKVSAVFKPEPGKRYYVPQRRAWLKKNGKNPPKAVRRRKTSDEDVEIGSPGKRKKAKGKRRKK